MHTRIKAYQFPRFNGPNQNNFGFELSLRVNQYFDKNDLAKTGNIQLFTKSAFFIFMYFAPIVISYFFTLPILVFVFLYSIAGVGMACIGFCIMHDANHGAYSSKKWINSMMGNTIALIGGNADSWKIQHNVLHHCFTNIPGYDDDIGEKPLVRLSPDSKWRRIHRYQSYYVFLLYGLSTLYWALLKDILQIGRYQKLGILKGSSKVSARRIYLNIILSKIIYFSVFFGLPYYIGEMPYLMYIAGFLIMHFFAGLITTVVFQLAHVVEDTAYFVPDSNNSINESWALHQLLTTSNFATRNRFISWFIGGLNFQIEHHLFPSISHVHYNKISQIVKETALEYGIPYYETKGFWQAICSHWKTLHSLGNNNVPLIRYDDDKSA